METDDSLQRETLLLLREISSKLDSFSAVLEDEVIVGVMRRYEKLRAASGGGL